MKQSLAIGTGLAVALIGSLAMAQQTALTYGPEETVYGSCRPALTLTNTAREPLDYVQVDMRYRLRDGRIVTAEQKSRYLYGVSNPIAPSASRALVIHHDESVPLGAPCKDITGAVVDKVICRSTAGDCATQLGLNSGTELVLPRR